MLIEVEIRAIVSKFAAMFKESANSKKDELPEYWEGYNRAVAEADAIRLHFENPVFPAKNKLVKKLFSIKAPHQTQAEADWILSNFKAITTPIAVDYINTISRPLGDSNWAWQFTDEDFKRYVEEDLPLFGSLDYYFKNILPTIKTIDPNGVTVWMPHQVKVNIDENGEPLLNEEGQATLSNDIVEPIPVFFESSKIVGQSFGRWYLLISEEKSTVTFSNKEVQEGIVLCLIDDENIYKIKQVGKKTDYRFGEIEVYYPHNIGEPPVIKLLGIPSIEDKSILYKSPYIFITPLLDIALLDNSTLQLSKAKCVFPYMIAVGSPCNFKRGEHECFEGKLFNDKSGKEETCPSCNGSGLSSRITPGGQLLVNPNFSVDKPNGESLVGDYIKFVSPDITTLEFLEKQIENNLKKAGKIMHLPDADAMATGASGETATNSLSKSRSQQAFVKPIIDQMFYWLDKSLYYSQVMRYGVQELQYNITPPTKYDISTPEDYINAIGEAVRLELPPMVVSSLIRQYVATMFFNSPQTESAYRLLQEADVMLTMNSVDALARVANGTFEKWRDVLHNAGLELIQGLVTANENFFEQDFTTQKTQLEDAAKSVVAVQASTAQEDLLNSFGS